jgi:hypothetical protein
MYSAFLRWIFVLSMCAPLSAFGQSPKPQNAPIGGDFSDARQPPAVTVPQKAILVKGAWSSASDSVTPLPEDGNVANNIFSDPYFGMTYPVPPDWAEKYKGPPPSDSGRYVLAELRPTATFKGTDKGTILITAQDMFFTPLPATNALELTNYSKDHLQADYKVEMAPTPTKIAGRSFTLFAYWSPVAELHWYVLTTEIRCHAIEIVLSSRNTKLLESLVADLNKMTLPAEASPTAGFGGGAAPMCVKDYAQEKNIIARVDPIFTEHKFNAVPVRIVIDKEGKVKHIHFLSAFPDQAKAIGDALKQWRFRPYRSGGQAVEVETGIMFGRSYSTIRSTANTATD